MQILVIIGPSGAGKSTIIRLLQQQGLIKVTPTWTTRPPRIDEQKNALEHTFVNEQEFTKLDQQEFFLETVSLFGLPYRYGLPKITNSSTSIPTIMLRAPLLPRLSKYYPKYRVYQIEDEIMRIKDRLLSRQTAGEKLGSRIIDINKEIILGHKLADRIFINTDLQITLTKINKALIEDFKP